MSGQSSADAFLWVGPSNSLWSSPSNWEDLTAGGVPALVAPGAGSVVTINGPVYGTALDVYGPGATGSLTTSGIVQLAGPISAGVLTLSSANAALTTQGVLTVGTLVETGSGDNVTALGQNASLDVSATGPVTQTLTASNNGVILLPAQVILSGGTLEANLPNSTVQIGGGTLGSYYGVVVSKGADLSGSGTVMSGFQYAGNTPETLSDMTVFGAVDSTNITVISALQGSGVINVLANGYFSSSYSLVPGSQLTFNIDSGATLELPATVDASNAVNFAGSNGAVEIEYDPHTGLTSATTSIDDAAAITGFTQGDRILGVIDRPGGVTSGVFTQTGATGDYSIAAGDGSGQAAASFELQGSYKTSQFQITFTPNYTESIGKDTLNFQVDLLPGVTFGVSAGSGVADSFLYDGLSGGAWSDSSNWFDVTKNAAAAVAPGFGDDASVAGSAGQVFTVLTQGGDAGRLTVSDNVAVDGDLLVNALVISAASTDLLVTDGGQVIATTLSISGADNRLEAFGTDTNGPGGFVNVIESATLGPGAVLSAAGGGRLQFASLTINGDGSDIYGAYSMLQIDAFSEVYANGVDTYEANNSAITIGTLNDATSGEVKIDKGATLTDNTTAGQYSDIGAGVDDEGTLIASNLNLHGLSGAGAVHVKAAGDLTTGFLATGSALSFQIDSAATLTVSTDGSIAGNSVSFTGDNGALYIDVSGSIADLMFQAPITGFGSGNSIELELGLLSGPTPNPIVSASITQSSASNSTLSLLDGSGDTVGSLSLTGDYAGDHYVVTMQSLYGVNVVQAEPGAFGLSPGTGFGSDFTYTGISGGAWGDASNWTDETNPLVHLAPGLTDNITVTGDASNGLTVLTGTGASSSLTFTQDLAIAGTVTTGDLVVGAGSTSNLYLDAGGVLDALSMTLDSLYLPAVLVNGPGATLDIAGTLSGSFVLGSAYYGSGGFTVENGGYLSLGGYAVNYAQFQDPYVRFNVSNGSTLVLPTSLPGDVAIGITGAGNTLEFVTPTATALAVLPTIVGFASSDLIKVTYAQQVASVAYVAGSNGTGVLDLLSSTKAVVGSLSLSGDYAGDTFYSEAAGPDSTEISLTPFSALCFAAGTAILTSRGDVAIEDLVIGDQVKTLGGEHKAIKWIGRRRYDGRLIAGAHLMLPVQIEPGAISDNVPARALTLSPGHGVYLDGVLVPAWRLINGVTITQAQSVSQITYLHIELADHDILYAEGCAAESFLDTDERNQFQNADDYHRRYPGPQEPRLSCVPRVESGFFLQAIQRRLAMRAGLQTELQPHGRLRGYIDRTGPDMVTGWAQNEADPETPVELVIRVAGAYVGSVLANAYRADLRAAHLGSGCHSFEVRVPSNRWGPIEICRSADQAPLAMTELAQASAAWA